MTALHARATYHEALSRLNDRHLLRDLSYVAGRWVAAKANRSFEVSDPASSATLAWVADLGKDETVSAIDAAAAAFTTWRSLLPQQRSAILRKWYELMQEVREDLALIMTLEQGKPLAESRGEIDYAAGFIEWYAEEAKRINVESVTSHLLPSISGAICLMAGLASSAPYSKPRLSVSATKEKPHDRYHHLSAPPYSWLCAVAAAYGRLRMAALENVRSG